MLCPTTIQGNIVAQSKRSVSIGTENACHQKEEHFPRIPNSKHSQTAALIPSPVGKPITNIGGKISPTELSDSKSCRYEMANIEQGQYIRTITNEASPIFRMLTRTTRKQLPYDVFALRVILAMNSGTVITENTPAILLHDKLYQIPLQLDLELRGVHAVEQDELIQSCSPRIPPFPKCSGEIPLYILLRTRNGLMGSPGHLQMNNIIAAHYPDQDCQTRKRRSCE